LIGQVEFSSADRSHAVFAWRRACIGALHARWHARASAGTPRTHRIQVARAPQLAPAGAAGSRVVCRPCCRINPATKAAEEGRQDTLATRSEVVQGMLRRRAGVGLVCLNLWVMKVSFIPTTIILLRRAVGPYFLRRVCLHPRQCVHSACIARSHSNELHLLLRTEANGSRWSWWSAPWEYLRAREGAHSGVSDSAALAQTCGCHENYSEHAQSASLRTEGVIDPKSRCHYCFH
jgi:hypothetical protein